MFSKVTKPIVSTAVKAFMDEKSIQGSVHALARAAYIYGKGENLDMTSADNLNKAFSAVTTGIFQEHPTSAPSKSEIKAAISKLNHDLSPGGPSS